MEPRGFQQRALRIANEQNQSSALARYLTERWAFGLLPATEVQRIASLAVADHERSPAELTKLAGLGTKGKHPNHCHVELTRALAPESILPLPFPIKVSMIDKKKLTLDAPSVTQVETTMVPPHALFSNLFHNRPIAFARRFLGCEDIKDATTKLTTFWSGVPDADPRKVKLKEAFALKGGGDEMFQRAVPLAVHGDGVPVGKIGVEAISLYGMLGRGLSTMDQKILMSGIIHQCASDSTAGDIWSAIVWSLTALWAGAHPRRDLDGEPWAQGTPQRASQGQPLAEGLFGVVWTIKGDQDWIANSLDLQHFSSRFPCPWCRCTKFSDPEDNFAVEWNVEPKPWFDYSEAAKWRQTTWTDAATWFSAQGGMDSLHPLFRLPSVSVLNLMADVLHIVDLGVAHHVLGNILYHICYATGPRFGSTPQARLDAFWGRVVQQYRGRGTTCRLNNLTLSMFVDVDAPHTKHPCLSTRVKAAETRGLVPVVADIWEDWKNPASDIEGHMAVVLGELAAFYECLRQCDSYVMPRATRARLVSSSSKVLLHYNALSALAKTTGRPMTWHQVPKFHYWQHVCLQASVQNPIWSWTYMDEDFMSIVKDIGESCTVATPQSMVVAKVVEKWRLGWGLRVSRQ